MLVFFYSRCLLQGVICTGMYHISDSVFLSAAEGLSEMVGEEDLKVGRLYPPYHEIR